jgi:uncharacterized membrane protein YqjE
MADARDAATRPPSSTSFDPSTQPQRPDLSLGELLGEMTAALGSLVRAELELAKTEAKEEVARAGKAAGMFGGAGAAGYLALIFLSAGLAWLLDQAMNTALSFALVGLLWLVIAVVLLTSARKKVKGLEVLPVTKDTLREDVQWAKAQKS